jgi:cytochrome c-type biogenesis protein CcmF
MATIRRFRDFVKMRNKESAQNEPKAKPAPKVPTA